jgi:hypothetical protein
MPETLYQLKVTLLDIKPPVWRRLVLDPGISLRQLHHLIQAAMGWEDYHLYEFQVGREHYGESGSGLAGIRPAAKTHLADVLQTARSKLVYVYDFGDEWRHEVRLERIWTAGENEPYTFCLDGARAGPPEDVGGPFGYAEWLEMLTGGDESEREEAEEVLGEDYDAERFDLEVVNQRLKKAGSRRR